MVVKNNSLSHLQNKMLKGPLLEMLASGISSHDIYLPSSALVLFSAKKNGVAVKLALIVPSNQ